MGGRLVVLVLWITACGFQGAPALGVDAAPDPPVDARPPITCGDLTCDPNAMCATTSIAKCLCNSGYAGDGMTCRDVDECANNNGGCPVGCENKPGGFACYAAATCAELKAHVPDAADGTYTLYLGGDARKPWDAYCNHMATTPAEYLSLTGMNYAQYTAGGSSAGSDVKTTYTKVRFDPATLTIDIVDRTFATSTGTVNHDGSGTMVTSMPYAVAMDCKGANSSTGVAQIDLTATKFALTGIGEFQVAGFQAKGSYSASPTNQRATISGGGNCGWNAPKGVPINPFNDNVTNGKLLGLVYQ